MDDRPSYHISSSLIQLKTIQEETSRAKINVPVLNSHFWCLTNGLECLEKLRNLSTNEYLKKRIEHLATKIYKNLCSFDSEEENGSRVNNLGNAFAEMRGYMMDVLIKQETDEYVEVFSRGSFWIGNLRRTNDFLLESMMKLISNYNGDESTPLANELKKLKNIVTYLKPLINYVTVFMKLYLKDEDRKPLTPLFALFGKTICLVYSSLVGTQDDKTIVWLKGRFSKVCDETDVRGIYLVALRTPGNEFCLLGNIIELLETNSKSLNNATSTLLDVLLHLRSFLMDLEENVRLKKLHYLQQSVEVVMLEAISIICSCYEEKNEEHKTKELNSMLSDDALNLIKSMKSAVEEIKLYKHPGTDTLGYLEYFLGYLGELWKCQEISSLKSEIKALYSGVKGLLFSLELNKEKYNEEFWRTTVNLAYQAEYLIDHFLATPSNNISEFKCKELGTKLNGILENIKADNKVHAPSGQSPPTEESAMPIGMIPRMMTTQGNDVVVGYEEEFETIKNHLLSGQINLDVLTVVGMTGVGKTALVRSLYTDHSTLHQFDTRAWFTASESCPSRADLLGVLGRTNPNMIYKESLDKEELCVELYKGLKKRRYLIVIDDMWHINAWNRLRRYLPDDHRGSRVLITTRSSTIADSIDGRTHVLRGLTKANSWELLNNKLSPQQRLPQNLSDILKNIANSCYGLPVSIVTIARVISNGEMTEDRLKDVAKNVRSHILADPQVKHNFLRSYSQLLGNLRACFLYLGAFPEDRDFEVSQLIRLWIAEGMIRETGKFEVSQLIRPWIAERMIRETESPEAIAKRYIDDLISNNLVIPVGTDSNGEAKTFRLHDLLQTLSLENAIEEHFFMVLNKTVHSLASQDPRRLSINCYIGDYTKVSCHSVRSVIFLNKVHAYEIDRRIESYDMLLVKVLDIGEIKGIPSFLSRLVLLKYLAIRRMFDKSSVLLSSISMLRNLQFLIFGSCVEEVVEIPDFIWDLVKLRQILIRPSASFHVDSNRLKSSECLLENLRSLSTPVLSYGDSAWLSMFPRLQELSCSFSRAGDGPKLDFLSQLTSLKVKCEEMKRCKLVLPPKLKKLTLSGFILYSEDISEIGTSLLHLEVLKLYDCGPWDSETAELWVVEDDEFPNLKVLKLRNLGFYEWVASEYSFFCVRELWLNHCDYLNQLPPCFEEDPCICFISVRGCRPTVDDSARKIEEMQRECCNDELIVEIYPKESDQQFSFDCLSN